MAAEERIWGNVSFPVTHESWARRIDCADDKKKPQTQGRRTKQDYGFLDVDLLCRKLELAKREREERDAASRLRKQVREAVKQDSNISAESERPRTLKKTSTNDGSSSKRASWYKLPAAFRKSQPTLSVNIPEAEAEQRFDFISPMLDHGVLDHEDRDLVLISRPTTPPEEGADQRWQQIRAKRSSFTVLKHFTTNDREQLRRIDESTNQRPSSANRRAQTVPFFKSKFMASSQKLAPADAKDSCRPSDVDDSFGGIVNEYTISFDTCPIQQNISNQARPTAAPVQRPREGSREGMSLLNIGTIWRKDKKDRTELRVEEIYDPLQEREDDDPHARRPHTRSQTAPGELISQAATRFKKDEKSKKRRSVGNLLQSLIAPNHSMSMHQVAI